MFETGSVYQPLEYGFLVGTLLPIPFYFLAKRYSNSWLRYINIPVMLSGAAMWAPYNFSYVWSAVVFGFIINYYIKRRYSAWWQTYAYVMTSSFAFGIAVASIVIFCALQVRSFKLNWWGNTVSYRGCDGFECSLSGARNG
jgi:hypothetical protein